MGWFTSMKIRSLKLKECKRWIHKTRNKKSRSLVESSAAIIVRMAVFIGIPMTKTAMADSIAVGTDLIFIPVKDRGVCPTRDRFISHMIMPITWQSIYDSVYSPPKCLQGTFRGEVYLPGLKEFVRLTVRLKTRCPGDESLTSRQKWPSRMNWELMGDMHLPPKLLSWSRWETPEIMDSGSSGSPCRRHQSGMEFCPHPLGCAAQYPGTEREHGNIPCGAEHAPAGADEG